MSHSSLDPIEREIYEILKSLELLRLIHHHHFLRLILLFPMKDHLKKYMNESNLTSS